MARDYYQFQVGYQIFQLEAQYMEGWPPAWPTANVLAWLRPRDWTTSVGPEFLMRQSDYATPPSPQMRLRPDHLSLSDGDPDTADLLAYLDLAYSNVHANTWLLGAYFQLMSGAYAENDYYTYFLCSPGYYSDLTYQEPFVRVQDAAFVIHDWTGSDWSIPAGSCSLYWDDVNHKLKARDHSETDYTIGP